MSMTSWAEHEIELAIDHECRGCENEYEAGYGIACYESALKAYKSLMEDGHSGLSIGITKSILNNLIDGRPLTPIEDSNDIWRFAWESEGVKVYQCTRMSSLFKYVHLDNTVTYSSSNSCYCVDIHNPNNQYSNGFIRSIIEEMFPITMPYRPSKPIKVVCEDLLTDEKNGDFDTMVIHYIIKPDDTRIDIYRYFKESKDNWVEIDEKEFTERKLIANSRLTRKQREDCNNGRC